MENIRLVIWDLDDTFWNGTLSEENVSIPCENINIINTLTDRGIMNSICSKNDYNNVKERLEKENLWDLFIFPKISWNPKGEQVKQLIEQVQLRPESVLFIDDNPNNLAEVKFYNPNINISGVEIINDILNNPLFEGKNDSSRTRLKQYKILEAKQLDKENAGSNLEFLRSSNIRVSVCNDCAQYSDRIFELINRTNQLNFTKNRLTKEQVLELLDNEETKCGCIRVIDNYGDYGIVGFYSLKNNVLENFCFSCRILGLGVEQYVYAELGFPRINLVGKTVTKLKNDYCPDWVVTQSFEQIGYADNNTDSKKLKVSLVGGCDLKSVAFYLNADNIKLNTLFNYDYNGFIIHKEHTELIRGSFEYDDERKKWLIKNLPFYDESVFDNHIFEKDLDIIVFSPLIDYSLGIYEYIDDNTIRFVYGNGQKGIDASSNKLSKELIQKITDSFVFKGIIDPERLYDNLSLLRSRLNPKTKLIVINGSEQDVFHPDEPNRVEIHKQLNKAVEKFCDDFDNTFLLDVNEIIHSTRDHTDSIRHYTRRVYFEIANRIITTIHNISTDKKVVFTINNNKSKTNKKIFFKTVLRKIGLYKFGYKAYRFFMKR